jgi:hypothetical protein
VSVHWGHSGLRKRGFHLDKGPPQLLQSSYCKQTLAWDTASWKSPGQSVHVSLANTSHKEVGPALLSGARRAEVANTLGEHRVEKQRASWFLEALLTVLLCPPHLWLSCEWFCLPFENVSVRLVWQCPSFLPDFLSPLYLILVLSS